jgi:hypothetical protein
VRLEELRAFMAELVHAKNLRDAAALVGLGHEALRKFVLGKTKRPHDRSIKAMAQVYLDRQKVVAAEREALPTAGQLKLVLPRGEDAGSEAVREVFDALREAKRSSATADALEQWLLRRLREEYAVEPNWGARPKRSRQ